MFLVESLKCLGLNDKEAKVYIALLQSGQATAYGLAIRSGLKKPTTYVILDQLIEKGFAYKVPRAKKQYYVAESPEKCFSLAKEKLILAQDAVPRLMDIHKRKETKAKVSYYQGIRGSEEMYNKMFKKMNEIPRDERELVGFYAKENDIDTQLQNHFERINETIKAVGIKRKSLTVYHASIINKYLDEDFLKDQLVEIKALSEKVYSSNVSIEAYGNYVQLFSHHNLQAILIEDEDAAKAVRQIFEMVWALVEKDREKYLKFSSLDENKQTTIK